MEKSTIIKIFERILNQATRFEQSPITTGAWRAPVTNFLAFTEQSFLDEIAERLNQNPVDFRLTLLRYAQSKLDNDPTFELDYEPLKMIGVIED